MENNTFQFHIDCLLNKGLVQKTNKKYRLTTKGKQIANRIDNKKKILSKQALNAVRICCTREVKGTKQFLIYTRKKDPWYGCQGFLAGKLEYGEKILETAKRALEEEADLTGNPKLVAVTHILDVNKESNEVLSET